MLEQLKNRIKSILFPDYRYKHEKFRGRLEKVGSDYGGTMIPVDMLNKDSICYLAGAGEDISLDIALADRFHCTICIFDPTPRAKAHFEKVKSEAIRNNQEFINYLEYYDFGVWHKTDTLKFFAPRDPSHVSHSITNLQQTSEFFEARVKSVGEIMKMNGHARLDMLKLDIEGAEFVVIDSILRDRIDIKVLCVEFHKREEQDAERIQSTIDTLQQNDYAVVARKERNFTFVHKKWMSDLQPE